MVEADAAKAIMERCTCTATRAGEQVRGFSDEAKNSMFEQIQSATH